MTPSQRAGQYVSAEKPSFDLEKEAKAERAKIGGASAPPVQPPAKAKAKAAGKTVTPTPRPTEGKAPHTSKRIKAEYTRITGDEY